MTDTFRYLLDWTLEQSAFRNQIRDYIRRSQKNGTVLALPIWIRPGQTMFDLLTLLLSQVNCDSCDSQCCRRNPHDELLEVLRPEYLQLVEKYGDKSFTVKGEKAYLPMPCPFLKDNSCAIYQDRPLVCVLYPFQPGATDGKDDLILAVASSCPEGQRIARSIYMTSWRLRRQLNNVGMATFLNLIKS